MHRPPCSHNVGAIRRTDRLVSKADAEQRRRDAEAPYHIDRDPRFRRRARAWRDDDVGGRKPLDLLQRDRVIPPDERRATEFANIPGEVIDERVVVVDEEDHTCPAPTRCSRLSAAMSARALSSVSRYSSSGSESATIPP